MEPKEQTSRFTVWFFLRRILTLIGYILLGIVLVKLVEKRSVSIMKHMLDRVLVSMGLGFVYLVSVPVLLALMLFTFVGIPLSILGVPEMGMRCAYLHQPQ